MNHTAIARKTLPPTTNVRWRLAGRAMVVTICTAIANVGVFAMLLSLGLGAGAATIGSACLVLIPKFFASRHGVWTSASDTVGTQAVRFFAVSSVFVAGAAVATEVAAHLGATNNVLVLCNFGYYTLAWIVRFVVMDRYVFGS